jgi:phage terminase small subunit
MKLNPKKPLEPQIKKRPGRKPGTKLKKKYIKIRRFVSEYMVDHNETKAWQRCGYGSGNSVSDMVASRKVLNRGDVQVMIFNEEEKRNQKTEVTADKLLHELEIMAMADISKIATWDGNSFNLKSFNELTRDQIALIQSLEIIPTNQGITLKFKHPSASDKKTAIDALMVYRGYYKKEAEEKFDVVENARRLRDAQIQMDKTDGVGQVTDIDQIRKQKLKVTG